MSNRSTLTSGYDVDPAGGRTAAKPGIWARIVNSAARSRQRRAETEIGRFLQLNGGQLTDELEREISRRFGGPAGGR